ncbi:MAG TPA: IMP dehydrogenase [Vicinamibacteria bacterium]|nr:IMP dehydrogenase [Vicinamibacteria bacterium]
MDIDPRFLGRTFGDFLFRPQKGRVASRAEISLASPLARSLSFQLPVVSSNMDSVTEWEMARTMALEGGIGIVHRAMSIERQAEMVRRVKRSHSAVIESPLRLPRGVSIREAKSFAVRHHITAILIEETQGSGVLAGLLTNRDVPRRADLLDRPVDEFMTPFERLHVSPPGIGEDEAERLMFDKRIERLPLVDEARRIRGLITLRDILFFRNRPFSSKDGKGRLLVGAAIGARGDFLERAAALVEAEADLLVIDIAHAHSEVMEKAVAAARSRFETTPLLAGNVATYEGAKFLADCGVDAIKVGVGPGRGCRTRLETSAGVPQLQAIHEAYCAVEDRVPIVADGGISHDKDIFLALVAGASSVMLGSALSGTDESPGHLIEDPATHQKRKIYRGMTSPQAVFQSLDDATNGDEIASALATPAEGMEIQVAYKGSVVDVLRRIRGHLQSAVSYAGEGSLACARAKILQDPFRYLVPLSESSRRESYER